MKTTLTVKNYRCFPETRPASVELRNGFTALVGVNNSGKSSLLKFFYEFRHLFQTASSPSALGHSLRGPHAFNYPPTVYDPEELFSNINNHNLEIEIETTIKAPEIKQELINIKLIFIVTRGKNEFTSYVEVDGKKINAEDIAINDTGTFRTVRDLQVDLNPLLHACQKLSYALYIGPFRNAINVGTKENYFDIQVGQGFIEQWRNIKEGKIKKTAEAAIRLTNDIKRIFEYESLEINPSIENDTLTVFINGKNYKLPELGSGITQFILVLANASIRKPTYILIDEPELNLHPSLQLDFLTTLASYATDGIIFSTHSIGLARASAETVYAVRKLTEGESEVKLLEEIPQLPVFLGELSFSEYSELGFEKILLVEGVTDVKCLQQFLRLYGKDHKIVILPLGGHNLINERSAAELQEITRITKNVFALIDSERSVAGGTIPPRRAQFVKNCKRARIKCHVLEKRATENYFTDRAVKIALGDAYKALGPFEKLSDIQPSWSKTENWRITREMTDQELRNTDLGRFLKSI